MSNAAERAIYDAFMFFLHEIEQLGNRQMDQYTWSTPCFTYILTKKQFNQLKVLCSRNAWPTPLSPAVPITRSMLKHVLSSRKEKDKISLSDCAAILRNAFSPKSEMFINRDYPEQAISLNARSKIHVGGAGHYALAIIEVSGNNLAPVTAYHATEAKCKAIQRSR